MNCFWSTKNTMSVGRATRIAPAATRLLSTKNWPLRLFSADVIGHLVAGPHQHQGPEEVVVDPGHLERREGGERRPRQRQDDLPVDVATPTRRRRSPPRSARAAASSCSCSARTCRTQLEGDVDRHDAEVLVVQQAVVARGSAAAGSGSSRYIRNSGVMMTCGGSRLPRREQHQQERG